MLMLLFKYISLTFLAANGISRLGWVFTIFNMYSSFTVSIAAIRSSVLSHKCSSSLLTSLRQELNLSSVKVYHCEQLLSHLNYFNCNAEKIMHYFSLTWVCSLFSHSDVVTSFSCFRGSNSIQFLLIIHFNRTWGLFGLISCTGVW